MAVRQAGTRVPRVSPEDVKSNAHSGLAGGRGPDFFKLPKGVRSWEPEKADTFNLNVVPYLVKMDNHPDKKPKKGDMWFKFPFIAFRGIGVNSEWVASPASIGLPCPIMEDRALLAKDYKANEQALKTIAPKKWVAYVIDDPADPKKLAVFAYARSKFTDALDKELDEGDEKNLSFYDVVDGLGRTLKTRFSDETFDGRAFLQASRIDFTPRPDRNEAAILAASPCLEECFRAALKSYDEIKKLYLQLDPDDDPNAPRQPAPSTTARGPRAGKTTTTGGQPTPTASGVADTEPAGDGMAPTWDHKIGDMIEFEEDGKKFRGRVTEVDVDIRDLKVIDDDGDEHEVDFSAATYIAPEQTAVVNGRVKSAKAAKAAPAAAQPEMASPANPPREGDTVRLDDGREGIAKRIKGQDVKMIFTDGTAAKIDIDDIESILLRAGAAAPAEEPEVTQGDTDADDDPDDDAPLAVGDKVTWEDGVESGEIVKIKQELGIAKVKDNDGGGILSVNLADLKRADDIPL